MNNSKEYWYPIADYVGLYEVSTVGRVRSVKRNLIMKQVTVKGYSKISLSKNDKQKMFFVHRLVAFAFIENTVDGVSEVNHIDGIKSHNFKENLEWITRSGNMLHAYANDLKKANCKPQKGIKNGRAIVNSELAKEIRLSLLPVKDICAKYNIKKSQVYNIRTNKVWN